jgi:hypothetical protein
LPGFAAAAALPGQLGPAISWALGILEVLVFVFFVVAFVWVCIKAVTHEHGESWSRIVGVLVFAGLAGIGGLAIQFFFNPWANVIQIGGVTIGLSMGTPVLKARGKRILIAGLPWISALAILFGWLVLFYAAGFFTFINRWYVTLSTAVAFFVLRRLERKEPRFVRVFIAWVCCGRHRYIPGVTAR